MTVVLTGPGSKSDSYVDRTCSVEVRQGDFDRLHLLRLEQWTPDQAQLRMMALNRKFSVSLFLKPAHVCHPYIWKSLINSQK